MALIDRNQNSRFKKRHYVAIIKWVVEYCTRLWGYTKKPLLFESTNKKGELMCICRGKRRNYAIFYDYVQFKKLFDHLDFQGKEAYAMFLTAHEMRHYYQMRQLDCKNPSENEELLEKWRADDTNVKYPSDSFSILEFYRQPMEKDAELFAYVYTAEMLDVLVNLDFIDENYIKELEEYYIELFGETDEIYFPEK